MHEIEWQMAFFSLLVFLVGYGLNYLAHKRDVQNGAYDEDTTEHDPANMDLDSDKYANKTGNSILDKWLDFGGGYYGTVALIQLCFIEVQKFQDFLAGWSGLTPFFAELQEDFIVEFLVGQFIDFAEAIVWPAELFEQYSTVAVCIFLALTIMTYELAKKVSRKSFHFS